MIRSASSPAIHLEDRWGMLGAVAGVEGGGEAEVQQLEVAWLRMLAGFARRQRLNCPKHHPQQRSFPSGAEQCGLQLSSLRCFLSKPFTIILLFHLGHPSKATYCTPPR